MYYCLNVHFQGQRVKHCKPVSNVLIKTTTLQRRLKTNLAIHASRYSEHQSAETLKLTHLRSKWRIRNCR